jgi:hypothetical protein
MAVTAIFAANGAMFATLFARMPAIKAHAGMSAGELGAGLLVGSVALIASQLAWTNGRFTRRSHSAQGRW